MHRCSLALAVGDNTQIGLAQGANTSAQVSGYTKYGVAFF